MGERVRYQEDQNYPEVQGKIPFIPLEEFHQAGIEGSDYEIFVRGISDHYQIPLEEAEERIRQDYERGPYANQVVAAWIKCLIENVDNPEISRLLDNRQKETGI